MVRKILKWVFVIQERQVKNSLGKKRTERRLNPYNPLTYLVVLSCLLIGIILFGVVGVWGQFNIKKDFKWN